ncbi:MAG: thioredoxin domain-containing protein [Alphaproteobacteria bacterium]|nr:thioredoxin domain-containing protein [Alphaproteobacteria bacterium]
MEQPRNRLAAETSPYLLQHADNPVHWHPWRTAALAEARATGKPILLSVGYAACHWCHVMAHESFEDAETAALMNTLYVNVKVDREERPDIDHLYMSALQMMGEAGGWPLTMFLTPEGDPFWGGTYFPPAPRWGRPSFRQVLEGIAEAYRAEPEKVQTSTQSLKTRLAALSAERPGPAPQAPVLDAVSATLLATTDPEHGGMRGAPKFPMAPSFRFLWQDSFRTTNPEARAAIHLLLRRMGQGGIYDQLGGGFARYSTDEHWLAPHFEKMLYDNAQILELLALAQAESPNPLYAALAHETVGWLVRDMTAQHVSGRAAFAASEDADSEGEEGRFYVWTETEIDHLLGPAAPAFKTAYDVTAAGNWEGHTILRRLTPPGDADAEARLATSRALLLAALALFEATGEPARLDQARGHVAAAERWFTAPGARSYFATASDAADVPLGPAARPRTAMDQATPSGNGLMAEVLARLHHLTGEPGFRTRAEAVLEAFGGLDRDWAAAPTLLAAADLLENAAVAVIAGPADAPETQALARAALSAPDPALCVLRAPPGQDVPPLHPAHGKTAAGGSAAYLCRAGVCGPPLRDPLALAHALRHRGEAPLDSPERPVPSLPPCAAGT